MSKTPLTRRALVLAAMASLPALAARPVRAALGEDGMFHEPWFVETFLDLADDLEAATRAGRRFAVLWEQRGCPFCRDMHQIALADPAVAGYLRDNFDILQLDLNGARPVTDFDGAHLTEKAFAARYGIRITPTVQFFPEIATELGARPAQAREVARMPGYLAPPNFAAIFRFVRTRAYERSGFPEFLASGG